MEAMLLHTGSHRMDEQKWIKMAILSMLFHVAVFSSILFVPDAVPTRRMRNVVYEVDLVDLPVEKAREGNSKTQAKEGKRLSVPSKALSTRRIGKPKMEEKAVVIAKRTINVKAEKITTPEVSSAKLLDQIVPKTVPPAVEEGSDDQYETVSRLEPQPQGRSGPRTVSGIRMDIYKEEIKELIYSNWSYVALLGPNSAVDLSAVVELRIQKSGTILRTTMIKGSGNVKFDQSVLNAIKRSGRLPALPEGYRKTHEEIEITFNINDLRNQ